MAVQSLRFFLEQVGQPKGLTKEIIADPKCFLRRFIDDFGDVRGKKEFARGPKEEAYGFVAVFKNIYSNIWDCFSKIL